MILSDNLKIEIKRERNETEHFHQDAELIFVLDGDMDIRMEEQHIPLSPEGIWVANANHSYGFRGSEDLLFARITIPGDTFREC